tara:strand:- start:44 stop:289 length:246 start_codon:yes stop_codon:yes gene_type:complete
MEQISQLFNNDVNECIELMNFQEFYPYMCKNKKHENPDIQYMFEEQRKHLEPNNLPIAILIVKNRQTGQLRIIHINGKKKD